MSVRTRRLYASVVVALGSLAAALPAHAFVADNHNETLVRE